MFDHLLELSQRDNFNKWSYIRCGKEIGALELKIRYISGALATMAVLFSNLFCHSTLQGFYEFIGNATHWNHRNISNIWRVADTLICEVSMGRHTVYP